MAQAGQARKSGGAVALGAETELNFLVRQSEVGAVIAKLGSFGEKS